MKFIYKSCLLKLSGESLKNNDDLFSSKSIKPLVNQLKTLVDHKIQIGIIIGGGNI